MAEEGLEEAARLLRDGGLVAIPTETVYGLGANALDPLASARIFAAKGRPRFDPLIVHIADLDGLNLVVADVPEIARVLIKHFWPGPLTLVMRKHLELPSIVTSGLNTVAVRMPQHLVARELIRLAGVPIAAPSANSFGYLSPTSAEHVADDLGDAVDLIVDGGISQFGMESTILDVTGETPDVLRFGAIGVEEIEAVVGKVTARMTSTDNPTSPGQLSNHYSPHIQLFVVDGQAASSQGVSSQVVPSQVVASKNAAYLAFANRPLGDWGAVEVLSETGDLHEAAARFFEVLHRLDESGMECIWAELVPNEGLGRAINDRLRRAST